MGIETAVFISQLDAANPLSGDKKSQGDDHIRLLKAVLKGSFPNLDRAFYLSRSSTLAADTALDATYMNKVVIVNAAAQRNITLPALSVGDDGWIVHVLKASTTDFPVFVLPPSGAILTSPTNGADSVAKIRCDVPYKIHTFAWDGNTFFHFTDGTGAGVIEIFSGAVVPKGFGAAIGQSLLRADFPELFRTWSTNYGAVDGTHFNAPDLRSRFPVFSEGSYVVGATGGANTVTLLESQLPPHHHRVLGNTVDADPPATVPISATVFSTGGGVLLPAVIPSGTTGVSNDIHNHGIDFNSQDAGSGVNHENRPEYFALMPIFRLC